MRASDLLQRQFLSVNMIVHDIGDDLSDEEWTRRVLPETNLIGFDLWHVARTQDWAIQTLARGVPEVRAAPMWADKGRLATRGIGVGFTREQADELAANITRIDVLAYADAVHGAVLEWLAQLADANLDSIPDVAAHYAATPEYQTAAMRAETAWVFECPPCGAASNRPSAMHAII